MQNDNQQLPILVKILKKISQLNVLHLNMGEEGVDKILAFSKQTDRSFVLRSLTSKYNIIEKFLIRESDDSPSQIVLSQFSLISDKDMFFELSSILTCSIGSRIKVHVEFMGTESKLLFSQKVLDISNLIKRRLTRMNTGFMANSIFEVDILGNNVVLNIFKIENEFGTITNQAFICDNISQLEVEIDFTSLFKFSSFYQASKCLYFKDSDIEEERMNNKLAKLFYSYFQAEQKQIYEEFSFFNIKALAIVIQDIQGQSQQEARKNQIVPLIKKLLEHNQLPQQNQEANQVQRKIKARYLNIKKYLSSQNSNSLIRLLKELSLIVSLENETSKYKKVIFVIDSWELILEQSKSSTNMIVCAALMDFIQTVPSLILIQKQKDIVYQEMSPQISQLYI